MQDNLNDMMVFRLVAEQMSFTKAAESLGLPKSNISRKLTRLESSLGVRLIERTTRSLHLTEIGEIYLQHCQRIHDEVESAKLCVDLLANVPQGIIKVATSLSGGQALIAPLIADFYHRYPEIMIDMRLTNRRVDVIHEGFDVAIRVGQSPDSSLISKKLCSVQLKLFASPKYLELAKPIKFPQDLSTHKTLFMNAVDEKHQWELYKGNESQLVALSPSAMSSDFSYLATLAISKMGVILMPDYLFKNAQEVGNLVPVLPDWSSESIDIYAIYPSRQGATPKLLAFLDYLGEQLPHQ